MGTSRKKTLIVIALLLAGIVQQAGCGAAANILSSPGAASYREKWRASGVRNYRMKAVIQKTGHATPMGTFEICVRDGQIESVLAAASPSGDTVPVPDRPLPEEYLRTSRFSQYGTVESFFDHIEAAEKSSPEVFEVKYHPTLGYPTYLNLDPRRRTMDDELMVRVLELEPIDQ